MGMEIDIPPSVMGRPLKEAFISQGNSPAWCERILSASSIVSQNMRLGHVEGEFPIFKGWATNKLIWTLKANYLCVL